MGKVVIVGSGNVGSCAALLLALRGSFDEVVLVDKRPARARAEAADLMAALPYLAGGLAGGFLGGKLFRRVNMDWLRRVFALFILYGGMKALFF